MPRTKTFRILLILISTALLCSSSSYRANNSSAQQDDANGLAKFAIAEGKLLQAQGTADALRKANESYQKALTLYRSVNDQHGEGYALGQIAVVHTFLGTSRRRWTVTPGVIVAAHPEEANDLTFFPGAHLVETEIPRVGALSIGESFLLLFARDFSMGTNGGRRRVKQCYKRFPRRVTRGPYLQRRDPREALIELPGHRNTRSTRVAFSERSLSSVGNLDPLRIR